MENIDESENNAKVSDSAYSTSCSNSQSRRSRSSKSTHSGSLSSGSSGYNGHPVTAERSKGDKHQQETQSTTAKPENQQEFQTTENAPATETVKNDNPEKRRSHFREPTQVVANGIKPPENFQLEKVAENNTETSSANCVFTKEEGNALEHTVIFTESVCFVPSVDSNDKFSCVVSMLDGVVLYTTASLTTTLGFPKDLWVGRDFIDFIHPKDRVMFSSEVTNGLIEMNNGRYKVFGRSSNMYCRIRRYNTLAMGYGIKNRPVNFTPFQLKMTFRNVQEEEGSGVYLVVQATPIISAFKSPNETVANATPFIIRHAINGNIEHVEPESIPYMGYLPQDIKDKNILQLYHTDDMDYIKEIYESLAKDGKLTRSKPYRVLIQNGGYVTLETEWSTFVNPCSNELQYLIGKNHIIKGPENPDVFFSTNLNKDADAAALQKKKTKTVGEDIIQIIGKAALNPGSLVARNKNRRSESLVQLMEKLINQQQSVERSHVKVKKSSSSYYDRDSVLLGSISPHHEHTDSKSSTLTPLSYNQLNYNDNLQRYFDSQYAEDTTENKQITKEDPVKCTPEAQPTTNPCEKASSSKLDSADAPSLIPDDKTCCDVDMQIIGLTETQLSKHNELMENSLVKQYRENRLCTKREREKFASEVRQKKKEHIARCNESYKFADSMTSNNQWIGLKRPLAPPEADVASKRLRLAPVNFIPPPQVYSGAPFLSKHDASSRKSHNNESVMSSPGTPISAVVLPLQQNLINQAVEYIDPMNKKYKSKCRDETSNTTSNSAQSTTWTSKPKGTEDHTVTDGESSYSSFYSSFFKTESGSAEENGEHKRAKRKETENPASTELIYKYQIITKSMDEILLEDKKKMETMKQPEMVNEQLDQLYTDLQLQGDAARLTLEEGLTNSDSSGDDKTKSQNMSSPQNRTRKDYSKMTLIYEEEAPLPPVEENVGPMPTTSSAPQCSECT